MSGRPSVPRATGLRGLGRPVQGKGIRHCGRAADEFLFKQFAVIGGGGEVKDEQ